jgi:hypothetical protein
MDMRSERKALDKIYKRRDRYDIPDWQREEVWPTEKKRKLIDSILRGWKLPKLYFQKTSEEPDEFDVVDGQQRLTAVWAFFDGDLALSDESAEEFGGTHYSELPDSISDAFDDYEFEYDEITDATDEEVKEFFQRLQEGLPLTSSEKLNSLHSKLRDYCNKLAKHSFFSKTITVANKRYAHFDIAAKVVSLEIEGLGAGLRYEDIRIIFVDNVTFSGRSAVATRIRKTLDLLYTQFPRGFKAFRNRTIVQSMITFVCHLQQAGLKTNRGKTLKDFISYFLDELGRQVELGQQATDPDYLAFQRTVNANIRSGAQTRQNILLRKLFRKHPDFFSAVSQSRKLAVGINADVKRIRDSICDVIATTNERYAAIHGKDLFKPTNKSAKAINAIGNPITDIDSYKSFIDDLYFIFRESIGQRLVNQLPPSFSDVNDLRTMLHHDVDHGRAAKAASKRKKLATVFLKYSGVSSPDAVDPAQFPLVQANILGALEIALHSLAKSLT